MNQILSKNEIVLGNNYILELKHKLGSGAFGEIYKGKNITLNMDIAIKCESIKNNHHQRLKYEAGVLKYLNCGQYPPPLGIPALYDFIPSQNYNYMIMELLGPSLEDLFDLCGRKFSLKTILSLGDQMLCRIEFIHSIHLIHRDIKPDNFLMGIYNKKSIVYICDFGLCKKFRDQNGKHIPFKDGRSLTGTARYASIYSHFGYELSRRDDLESLAYSLIYFSRGSLPWMGIKAKNKNEKYNKIFEKKLNSSITLLCDKLPKEFIDFIHYIKDLAFEDKPDYQYLKSLLGKIYDKYKFNYDITFDFTEILIKKENKEKEQKEQNIIKLSSNLEEKEINKDEIKDDNKKENKQNDENKIEEKKSKDNNNDYIIKEDDNNKNNDNNSEQKKSKNC